MQRVIGGEPFNRREIATVVLNRQCQARKNPFTVRQDGAGAACALVTSFLGSGQMQMLTERVQQTDTWIESEIVRASIDTQPDGEVVRAISTVVGTRWPIVTCIIHSELLSSRLGCPSQGLLFVNAVGQPVELTVTAMLYRSHCNIATRHVQRAWSAA